MPRLTLLTKSVWFHRPCYKILKASFKPSAKPTDEVLLNFAEATNPLYEPEDTAESDTASVWEGLFSCYTKYILETTFRQELFKKLPSELQAIILDFIGPCWYLILLGETRRLIAQLRNGSENEFEQPNSGQEIYISRTDYQGHSYISRINHIPLGSGLRRIRLPARTKKIVLSIDRIGVRGVQFLDRDSDPLPDGSPWYQVLEVSDHHAEAHVSCDGLFVRCIWLVPESPFRKRRIWSSPNPPKFQPRNVHHTRNSCRLHYVKLGAEVQGLVVCCFDAKILGIYGFSGMSKAFKTFTSLMNRRPICRQKYWFFFPINPGEFIEAAWIRKLKSIRGTCYNPILVVSPKSPLLSLHNSPIEIRTTLGRTITFGPHSPAHMQHLYKFRSLVKDGDGVVSGIFHDGLDPKAWCVSEVGVTCEHQGRTSVLDSGPTFDHYSAPPTSLREGSPETSWYMTKASLEGLLRVRVCRDKRESHHPCCGLLLYYQDRRIESLGQIRWDQGLSHELLAPIHIEISNFDGKNYVKDIYGATADGGLKLGIGGLQLPERGTIVWWFGRLGDRIDIYNGTACLMSLY
ncbi:hypothetical protein PRK78_002245 [Emydomyces testavorans]|uniref:Uncharacterized protein n=1 Tax=Emydomyces testavorans TaxID=2070801 RepID=A0AAF0DDS6_9EURO|nr:hypothetical protein PRK78_002245 [Emydomyces testavorans]